MLLDLVGRTEWPADPSAAFSPGFLGDDFQAAAAIADQVMNKVAMAAVTPEGEWGGGEGVPEDIERGGGGWVGRGSGHEQGGHDSCRTAR